MGNRRDGPVAQPPRAEPFRHALIVPNLSIPASHVEGSVRGSHAA
jgi:hypothetical protein